MADNQNDPFTIPQQYEDFEEAVRVAFDSMARDLHFAYPAIVSKDSDGKTVKLKVAIKGKVTNDKGEVKHVDIDDLDTVPIHFPGGGSNSKGSGGFTLTHPITNGDEGMVVFSSRAIDYWREQGGTQERVDDRFHNLSDAMFIPNVRSKPRELKNVSTNSIQLRSDDEGGDKKPLHLVDINVKSGTITTSVDSGKHVTTVDKGKGISHKSSTHIHMDAPGITTKGKWNHDGGFKATGTVQSDVGLKAPMIDAAPGEPPDVGKAPGGEA